MSVTDAAKAAYGFFRPPSIGAGALEIHWWRWKMFVGGVGMVIFAAWALGLFASFGFYGFAYAQSANDQSAQISSLATQVQSQAKQIETLSKATTENTTQIGAMRTQSLDDGILKSRERQCRAIRDHNADARSFATERLQAFLQSYQDVTGRVYRLPACEEL